MGVFERYLSIWVALCIIGGVALGNVFPSLPTVLSQCEWNGVNLPIAILIWAMIFPMMVQIDFSSVRSAGAFGKGLFLTVTVNWLIKPFTMALIAWFFLGYLFQDWIAAEDARQYIAGAILLGVAPCTAMVFVWSYLSGGNASYTLIQVSVNDLIILIAFVPLTKLLLGIANIEIPWNVLLSSVALFVLVPLLWGFAANRYFLQSKGEAWFKEVFLAKLKPVSIAALLLTLLILFMIQSKAIWANPFPILLIAIPLTLQTYFIFFLTWLAGRFLGLSYPVCAPSAMIGASNFFELSVAVAIMLFGLNSGAALATVVGVLIEVPVMLSLVALAKKWKY